MASPCAHAGSHHARRKMRLPPACSHRCVEHAGLARGLLPASCLRSCCLLPPPRSCAPGRLPPVLHPLYQPLHPAWRVLGLPHAQQSTTCRGRLAQLAATCSPTLMARYKPPSAMLPSSGCRCPYMTAVVSCGHISRAWHALAQGHPQQAGCCQLCSLCCIPGTVGMPTLPRRILHASASEYSTHLNDCDFA